MNAKQKKYRDEIVQRVRSIAHVTLLHDDNTTAIASSIYIDTKQVLNLEYEPRTKNYFKNYAYKIDAALAAYDILGVPDDIRYQVLFSIKETAQSRIYTSKTKLTQAKHGLPWGVGVIANKACTTKAMLKTPCQECVKHHRSIKASRYICLLVSTLADSHPRVFLRHI